MIRILDRNIADKIAAGEVIDRPVSIIKELVENSIDAEASSITVEIKNGGKSYIRVTDNGCGIDKDQAELAFKRHATSKISTAEDLDCIGTLGFRGEALASICAVARVELVTKTKEQKTGRKIIIEGSHIIENTPVGCPEGTTVTVRDLFYNVPARKKFLSSDNSESRRIIDMMSRISLAYGDVKINLINGERTVFATRGNGNIFNNIVKIYGNDMGKDLLPVEGTMNGFKLKGFVSAPASSAPSRNKQIFCVNGRIVSSKVLERGLEEAYREKLFHGRFPIAFIFLHMPPEKLDVNVHPTKKEVRFDNESEVADFITINVKKALNVKDALPQVRNEHLKEAAHLNNFIKDAKQDEKSVQIEIKTKSCVNDISEIAETTPRNNIEETEEINAKEEVNIKSLLSSLRDESSRVEEERNLSYEISPKSPDTRPFDFTELNFIGAIFDTYIMAADDENFYLIDQHAAHERVFYEKLLAQYNSREKFAQQLLIPINFNVSVNIVSTEKDWMEDVKDMGYEMEFFGNNTYIIREIPAFMELKEAEDFLSDFFKSLEDKPDLTDKRTLEKIIMRSCKSAVKGGDSLSKAEIDALIKDLGECVNPFSCPHGRPTFIRMTKYEIEKSFKRV